MTQITYRANLSAAIFPLSLAQAGRSVIVPGPDNVYDRRLDPVGEQKNAGIPQAIYLENVIPTANGYQSVGYKSLNGISTGAVDRTIYYTRVIGGYIFAFAEGLAGFNQVYTTPTTLSGGWSAGASNWLAVMVPPYLALAPYTALSVATVRGATYVFVNFGIKVCTITNVTLTDVTGTFTGIVIADVQLFLASFNYLVAVMEDGTVMWSSTTTATDFTPSLVTGAGSARPNAVRSQIVTAYPSPDGFIIYTKTNAIAAVYTGNSRYPWRFKEIPDAGGHLSERNMAANINAAYHFSFNRQGTIVQIASDASRNIAPEVSTYVRNALCPFDSYNTSTNVITITQNYLVPYKIYYFLSKYIVLQFCASTEDIITGTPAQVWSIIYDTQLQRYGKISGAHSMVVEAESKLYTLSKTGVFTEVMFNVHDVSSTFSGVLILGKFQYVRARNLQLHSVEAEGAMVSASLVVLPSMNGKSFDTAVLPYISLSTTELISGQCRVEAKNHSLAIKGQFAVDAVEVKFSLGAAV